ncbi:MAG: hypothetical protein AAF654_07330 [Myxococcota bacterium]
MRFKLCTMAVSVAVLGGTSGCGKTGFELFPDDSPDQATTGIEERFWEGGGIGGLDDDSQLDAPLGPGSWIARFGGSGNDEVLDIQLLSAGEIVILGRTQGTLDVSGTTVGSSGETQNFIACFSTDFDLRWLRRFGDVAASLELNELAVENDRIYAVGELSGSLSTATAELDVPSDRSHALVIALDSRGTERWVRTFPSTDRASGNQISAVDGVIAVSGGFRTDVDIAGTVYTTGSAYLAQLSEAGTTLWSRAIEIDAIDDLDLGPDRTVGIAGATNLPTDLGDGELPFAGVRDAVFALFDDAGALLWARSYGGNERDEGTVVLLAPGGQATFAGSFMGEVSFEGQIVNPERSAAEITILRFDPSRTLSTTSTFGGNWTDTLRELVPTADGDFAGVGDFFNEFVVGSELTLRTSAYDYFVAVFDDRGAPVWAVKVGTVLDDRFDIDIVAGPRGDVYIAGNVGAELEFGRFTYPNQGASDFFVARLVPEVRPVE